MEKAQSRRRAVSTGAVTLHQVAEAAGVSLATASRALHGSGDRAVSEELLARVQAAAAELRYVSNGPAQALARSRTSVVGLIVHDVADPYFAAIAAGAMPVAREHGLMVMLAATFRDPDLELEYFGRLRAQRARAVVLAGSGFTDRDYVERLAVEIRAFEDEGGRVVCIGDHGVGTDAVVPDNHRAAAGAVRHLWKLGHRRIGIISGPPELTTVRHRLDGAARALRTLGSGLAEQTLVEADFTREGGRSATLRLLEQRPDLTAILAFNDLMAGGVLAALREEPGRAVPGEVSVMGIDDLPHAADLYPPLTTVRLPLFEIGAQAMRLIVEDEPADAPLSISFPAEVIVRSSTAPPPEPPHASSPDPTSGV